MLKSYIKPRMVVELKGEEKLYVVSDGFMFLEMTWGHPKSYSLECYKDDLTRHDEMETRCDVMKIYDSASYSSDGSYTLGVLLWRREDNIK